MRITTIATAIALLLAPTGVVVGAQMQETGQAVEQHTTFVEIVVGEDQGRDAPPGYAAVAGLVTCRPSSAIDNAVLWFNDQLLFRRGQAGPDASCLDADESTHVWATEDEAPDPRGNPSLRPTDRVFEFTDPNDRHWVVQEYVYHVVQAMQDQSADVNVGGTSTSLDGEGEVRAVEYHTWVVELKTPTLDPTINEYYSFVTVIDFEKLAFGTDGRDYHTGDPGDPRDGNSHDASSQDEEHHFPHAHDTATVDLWVGQAPEPGQGQGEEGARSEIRVVTPEQVRGPEGSAGPLTVENGD